VPPLFAWADGIIQALVQPRGRTYVGVDAFASGRITVQPLAPTHAVASPLATLIGWVHTGRFATYNVVTITATT
jgi:hypothetical protein